MSITYSSLVSRVSNTILQIQGRQSLGNFFIFWPSILLSIMVMLLVSREKGGFFLLMVGPVLLCLPISGRGKTTGYSFIFYCLRTSLVLFFSCLIKLMRKPSSLLTVRYCGEVLGQKAYILRKSLVKSCQNSRRLQDELSVFATILSKKAESMVSRSRYSMITKKFSFSFNFPIISFVVSGSLSSGTSNSIGVLIGGGKYSGIFGIMVGYFLILYSTTSSQGYYLMRISSSLYEMGGFLRVLLTGGGGATGGITSLRGTQVILFFFLGFAIFFLQSSVVTSLYPFGRQLFSLWTWSTFKQNFIRVDDYQMIIIFK